jgi:hypothetical protein
MSERPIIAAAVVVFVAGAGFPFWFNAVRPPRPLDLRLPGGERECVAPVAYMRTSHQDLLLQWRDRVVRHGVHTFKAADGRVRELSLTRTCLDCHEKAGFCDRCHEYVAVAPDCWNCHNDPRTAP